MSSIATNSNKGGLLARVMTGTAVVLCGYFAYAWSCDRLLVMYRKHRIGALEGRLAELEADNARMAREISARSAVGSESAISNGE